MNIYLLRQEKGVWIEFEPTILRKAYLKALKTQNQVTIARKVKKKQGQSTIEKYLISLKKSKKTCILPLEFTISLYKFLKIKDKINPKFLLLKNYKSQKVKFPKKINKDLAFILGAHVADGYLYKDQYLKISEGYKDAIIVVKNKVTKVFGIKPRLIFNNTDNTWNLYIKNKIIVAIFKKCFKIPSGKKAAIIKVPQIIKNTKKHIKKEFLKGILTFDGCVKTTGVVTLTSKSKHIIKFLAEFFKKEKILFKIHFNKRKNAWALEVSSGRKDLKKLLQFLEKGTIKHKRLEFFINPKKHKQDVFTLFQKQKKSKISLKETYLAIKNLKRCNGIELAKKLKVKKTTVYKYLYILEKAKLIKKEKVLFTTKKKWILQNILLSKT